MYYRLNSIIGLFDTDIKNDERFDVLKNPDNGEPDKVSQHDAEMFKKALYVGIPKKDWKKTVFDQSHNDLALEVAQKSIVLLKNEGDLFRSKKKSIKR
ncbi:hypothetical protein ACU8V7_03130 [Zobellia nedashkovskayae]